MWCVFHIYCTSQLGLATFPVPSCHSGVVATTLDSTALECSLLRPLQGKHLLSLKTQPGRLLRKHSSPSCYHPISGWSSVPRSTLAESVALPLAQCILSVFLCFCLLMDGEQLGDRDDACSSWYPQR